MTYTYKIRTQMNIKLVTIVFSALFSIFLLACGEKKAAAENTTLGASSDPAIDQLTQQIAQNPKDPSLYAARAGLFYEKEGYDEAIQDLQKALSFDSTNVQYLHALADAYLDYYKSRQALETMEKAAKFYPTGIPTLLKLSEFQLILKKYDESMRTVDAILQIDPQNANAYLMFGLNFKEKKDTIRAINSFQKAVELNPDLMDAWINLGQLHAGLGNKIAAQYFNTAITIAPENVDALHAKAQYLQDQNDLKGAISLYKSINVIDPQYEEAYYNTGLLYLDLDSIPQAYQAFNIAIDVNPVFVQAYYFRGVAAEMQGKKDLAKADYEQALKLAPDYEAAQEALKQLQ